MSDRQRPGTTPLRTWRAEALDPSSTLHHGGSFSTYFAHKNLKLREQFEANCLQQGTASSVFRGVCIHVNGYTKPGHQELKQLMALHGGAFETYFHRDRVTHIVCDNLPDTKLKHLEHERKPLPIVRAEWVVASIRAGKLQPVGDFQLERVCTAPGQRRLADFAQHTAQQLAPADIFPNLQQVAHEQQQRQQQQAQVVEWEEPQQQQQQQQQQRQDPQVREPQQQQPQPQPQQPQPQPQPQDHDGQPQRQPLAGLPPPPPQQAPVQMEASASGHHRWAPPQEAPVPGPGQQPQPCDAGPACDAGLALAQQTAARLRAACEVLKGPPRTTKDDPNFLATFYRSSRLHFIGTWRARIEPLIAALEHQAPAPRRVDPAGGITRAFAAGGGVGSAGSVAAPRERSILHLDMDCFFAAVAVVGRPEFKGRPLAVCHSNSAQGSAEVSCVNYEARAFGISAGMRIAEAKRRCPEVIVVPYEFEKYPDIAEQVYRILLRYSGCVQPISCDEAFVDLTGLGDPMAIASAIRAEILAATQCPASAGIGPNLLLARLATRRAKPNGQFHVRQADAQSFLGDLPVSALPGVGWSLSQKLQEMGINQVRQVWAASKENMCRKLGRGTGLNLWNFAHGLDDRPVETPKARKSVGAEVNYGIRFDSDAAALTFLDDLAGELTSRLQAAGVKGRCLTLKVKRRQVGAPEPGKFLGMGICDSLSRSVTLGRFVDAQQDVAAEAKQLLTAMQIPCDELRGLGLQMTKLDTDAASKDARPSAPAPSKLPAPKPTVYQPSARHAWFTAAPPALGNPSASGASGQGAAGGNESSKLPATPSSASKQPLLGDSGPGRGASRAVSPGEGPPAVDSTAAATTQAAGRRAASAAAAAAGAAAAAAAFDQPAAGFQPPPPPQLVREAVCGGRGGHGRVSPPIAVLPPMSQLDQEVLDALPLVVRKELERAYGTTFRGPTATHADGKRSSKRPGDAAAVPAAVKRRRGQAPPAAAPGGRARGPASRGGSPVAHSPPRPPTGPPAAGVGAVPLRYSQLDPSVLRELPPELQREVLAALPGGRAGGGAAGAACALAAPAGSPGLRQSGSVKALSAGLKKVVGPGRWVLQADGDGALGSVPLCLAEFVEEPWSDVRHTLSQAMDAVLAAEAMQPAGPDPTSTAGALHSPQQGALPRAAHTKLAVLAEMLLQWLLGRDDRLDLLQRCLQWLGQVAEQKPAFAQHAAAVEAAVQAHVLSQYGFRLRGACVPPLGGFRRQRY